MLLKKITTLVVTALSLYRPIPAGPPAEPRQQSIDPVELRRISDMVGGFIEAGLVVGAELLILHDGEPVFHEAYGVRDVEGQLPMERGTLFNIRSMAKPIVGSIAMRLIDRDVISLDDRVGLYLPTFRRGESDLITISHLHTHRSGLPDGNPAGRPEDYPTLRSIADYWGGHGPTEFSPA